MTRILLSGPAGANKSRAARVLRMRETAPTILIDFQAIYAAISRDIRNELGRYPLRDERLLPIVEYLRQSALSAISAREIGAIMTNSDGNPARRASLLQRLGSGAREEIIDPGQEFVEAALTDPFEEFDAECDSEVGRWYTRLSG